MKKYLLSLVAVIMVTSLFAQKKFENVKLGQADPYRKEVKAIENYSGPVMPRKIELNEGKDVNVTRYTMGKSANIYSVLTSYQRCLFYDEASNAILGTFRADPATYPAALSSGSIMSFYSSDLGENWDWQVTINPDANVHALRYPSGVIYNPNGESDIENAYVVAAGPSHMGGTWDNTFFGSAQLNNTNHNEYYNAWESENDWARSCMTVVPDAVYNFGQDYTTIGNLGVDQTMKQYVGTSSNPANGFSWEINEVTPDWLIDNSDGHAVALYTTWSAWSRDGSIGYMWLVGVTNDSYDYGVFQPQIYYTVNGGNSWNYIELDLEDHPVLIQYLSPSNLGSVRPTFLTADRTYPGVVDYQGKLHLFSNVYGSSDGTPESGYWIEGDATGGIIFDFVIDVNGIHDVIYIDDVKSVITAADAFGDVGWNHSLQASKSLDEKVVFSVWTDDPNSNDGTVTNPDIYAWGYNVETDVYTDPIDFTSNTLYAGFYFFPFVSELTPLVNGVYKIPVSSSLTPSEYAANDPLAPVTHNYVDGIDFDADFFGSLSTQMFVNPAIQDVNTAEVFTTTIEIADVENLGSFELELNFDPSLLQMNSLTLGDFLGSTGRTIFPLINNIDNTNGLLQYAVTTLGPNPPGANGDGILLNIEWTATSNISDDAVAYLVLQNAQVTEPNGTLIPFSIQNGQVNIQACYSRDFDCDCDVDIVDVTMAAYTYGTSVGDPNYDSNYDLDNDGDIDIVDITMVTYDYGWTCGKSAVKTSDFNNLNNENVSIGIESISLGEDEYVINFFIEDVEQFGGFEFLLQYDTKNLEIINTEGGGFISKTGRNTIPLKNYIDDNLGRVDFAITTLGSLTSGANGQGSLFKLRCKTLNGKEPLMEIIHAQIVRIDAQTIPFKIKYTPNNLVENNQSYIVSTFPSPIKDRLNIKYYLGTSGEFSLQIYNAFGNVIWDDRLVSENPGFYYEEFNDQQWNPGLYIIVLEQNNRVMDTYRVIVN